MCLYQQFHIAQPQADAGYILTGRTMATVELIENPLLLIRRDADSVIADTQMQSVRPHLRPNVYLYLAIRVFDGILQQIAQYIG